MEDGDFELEIGAEDKNGSFMGNLILVVIAIAFVIGFFGLAKMMFEPLVNSALATQWEPAEGVIESSALHVPDRRQYRIEARFSYVWDGVAYTSQDVFFDDMIGVRRTYYQNVNRELLRHKSPENPITVWVNPNAPEQAVIYRQVRWDKFAGNMLLLSIWGGIMAVLVGASIATLRK